MAKAKVKEGDKVRIHVDSAGELGSVVGVVTRLLLRHPGHIEARIEDDHVPLLAGRVLIVSPDCYEVIA